MSIIVRAVLEFGGHAEACTPNTGGGNGQSHRPGFRPSDFFRVSAFGFSIISSYQDALIFNLHREGFAVSLQPVNLHQTDAGQN
jgi:hypothetical protein